MATGGGLARCMALRGTPGAHTLTARPMVGRRGGSWGILALLPLLVVGMAPSTITAQTVNDRLVRKRRARADAKKAFEDSHVAAFDEFGRVIRYGFDVDEVTCDEKGDKFVCRVTEFSRRMYLTKEEQVLARQIKMDKQEELDSSFGEDGPGP